MQDYYKHGSWNALCDRCGFKYKADQLRKTWDGLYVCKRDWEERQPLEFIRGIPDKTDVPWTRSDSTTTEIELCYLWERSSYADLATADCATADTTTFTYAYLLALKNGTL